MTVVSEVALHGFKNASLSLSDVFVSNSLSDGGVSGSDKGCGDISQTFYV